jgi:uncharacterized membrane protein YfcA
MTWQFTLSGFLIGALVGITGMGGGSLLTPILVIFFGFKPTLAVGTDILHGAIFKSFGAVRHRRLGTVHARLTFWMFLGSGPMSLLGVAVATWLTHHYGNAESIESYAIGVALMAGGVALVAKTFVKRGVQPDDAPFLLTRRDRLIAFTLGATDIFHAAALLWVAGFGHLVAGNVDLRTMGWLLTGSIPGILLTSHFTLRIPPAALRLGLACVLTLSGIKLIDFPHADWAIASGAVAAGICFAVWALIMRLGRRPRPETVS